MNKKAKTTTTTIGYLRVSTVDQDVDKFKGQILAYANDHSLGRVTFCEEHVSGAKSWRNRKLAGVVEELGPGDTLLVPELSRLGRSIVEVLEVLNLLKAKGVKVISIKEGFTLNGDGLQAKVMSTLLALFAEIERDLISQRTKEGLAAVRASGKRLGRPKGPGKSKLDRHKARIKEMRANGAPFAHIARELGCTAATVSSWCRRSLTAKV